MTPTPRIQPDVTHLTERELEARWKLSRTKLREMRKAGEIPFIRFGDRIRYRAADILKFEEATLTNA